MFLKGVSLYISIILFSASCAFVPEVSDNQKYSDSCNMLTKKLTLSAQDIKGKLCDDGDDIETCLMLLGVIVPVGSLVLSGGVVIAGNTLHWLEYQGTCNEGFVLRNIHN